MRCGLRRQMWGINEMQAVRGYWGVFRGMAEKEYLIVYPGSIVLREIKRDVYIVVELTSRPTIRVVPHL